MNQNLHLANPHDKLSTFVLYPSLEFSSIYRLTLWDLRLRHLSLSLVTCRMEVLWKRIWALTISIFCLEWLRYRWFSMSLFMDFDSPCCNVPSSLTLWVFSYTLLMLTWNMKLLLFSLILVACIIINLSYILLLVWLDLFTACGVHRLDYTCFLCGLICSPLVECTGQIILPSCAAWFVCHFMSQWLDYDPCLFHHGVHLQCRCNFQLAGFYPCFEMSCLVVHIFFVDGEWMLLVIIDDCSHSCGFCA
jgi:hypothetical protein